MFLNPDDLDVQSFSIGEDGEGTDTIPGPPSGFDADTSPEQCPQ